MEKSNTSAGEPEILALVHVIKCPIAVHYRGTDKALFLEKLTKSLLTRFIFTATQTGKNSPGHYDLLFYEGEEVKPTELRKLSARYY